MKRSPLVPALSALVLACGNPEPTKEPGTIPFDPKRPCLVR